MTFKKIPNILTLIRVILIPIICASFLLENKLQGHIIGILAFFIACATDFFDGYLARAYNIQSNFGRIFDPIADKLLVSSCLIMMTSTAYASPIPTLVIILREIFISGIREALSMRQISVKVSSLSKFKTLTQLLAILCLFFNLNDFGLIWIGQFGKVLLWIAAFITLYTGMQHFNATKKHLTF